MTADAYRRALDAALREYEHALAERARLDDRLAELQQTIGSLTKLCGYTPTVPFGLTDACRLALRSAGQPMTAVGVRDRLRATGFDLDRYANPLAAIHTVLKRLAAAGEAAAAAPDAHARVAYAHVAPAAPAMDPRPARRRRRTPQAGR